MRVGLDAHMVGSRETGNESYVKGLVEGFESTQDGLELVVYHVGRPWTDPGPHVTFERLVSGNPFVRLGLELPARSASGVDLLHMSYASPLWTRVPVVVTVHDVCYASNPEWFSARDLRVLGTVVPRAIRKAARVITDSEAARRDIVHHYPMAEEKIAVVYVGPGAAAQPIARNAAAAELTALGIDLRRPYILVVGNLQPRKNLVRLVEAFSRLVRGGLEASLVVVGPSHYRASDAFGAAAALGDRVHFTGYVSDRQLAACYELATVFVFPSLYEGFGMPALEAMSHGVPCLCSNAGALPEICGEAALYFDPTSVDAIAEGLQRMLADAQLRARLGSAARGWARRFSWTRAAEETIAVYRQALS